MRRLSQPMTEGLHRKIFIRTTKKLDVQLNNQGWLFFEKIDIPSHQPRQPTLLPTTLVLVHCD